MTDHQQAALRRQAIKRGEHRSYCKRCGASWLTGRQEERHLSGCEAAPVVALQERLGGM